MINDAAGEQSQWLRILQKDFYYEELEKAQ